MVEYLVSWCICTLASIRLPQCPCLQAATTHCFAFERRNSDATARCEPQPGGWGHTHLVNGVPGRTAPAMGAHVQVHSRKIGKSDLALERGNQQTCEFCGTTSYASTVFKLQQPRALVISDLQGKHSPGRAHASSES
jgi:hypothetical protein